MIVKIVKCSSSSQQSIIVEDQKLHTRINPCYAYNNLQLFMTSASVSVKKAESVTMVWQAHTMSWGLHT